jgi:hypothetical protein
LSFGEKMTVRGPVKRASNAVVPMLDQGQDVKPLRRSGLYADDPG